LKRAQHYREPVSKKTRNKARFAIEDSAKGAIPQ
jgi:hypothetical protein